MRKRAAERYTFDGESRVTKVETGSATAATDAALNAMTVLQTIEYLYDNDGNRTRQTVRASDNSITNLAQFTYDNENRLKCAALRMNPAIYGSLPASACTMGTAGTGANAFGADRITQNIYDANGRITQVKTALGTAEASDEVTTAYTANGRTSHVIDAEGNKTSYIYDGFDRVWQIDYPHKTNTGTSSPSDDELFTYDKTGNVIWHIKRDNRRLHYTYDKLGRLTRKRHYAPGSGFGDEVNYGYDLLGRALTLLEGGAGSGGITNVYDALGRLGSTTDTSGGGSRTASYQYDVAGRRTRLTWDDGFYVTYDWKTDGSISRIRENGSASLAFYSYDADRRVTQILYGNGARSNFSFDSGQRLATMLHNPATQTYDNTVSFAYNPAGQISELTRSNDAYAWSGHYNEDKDYSVNGLNQITAAGTQTITHDAAGNLSSDGNTSYTYDVENRLTSSSGSNAATLSYDPVGRLLQTTGNGVTTKFTYDGGDMIAEYDASGNITRRYVHGPGTDNPFLWYEGAGTSDKRYMMADERGSITAITGSTGAVINVNAYDEYGIPANSNIGRFQYTGQTWLPEIELYYYKARAYDPRLGRFLQTDPIGYGDGMNWYNYVGGDPVNFNDPTGLLKNDDDEGCKSGNEDCDDPIIVTGLRKRLKGGGYGGGSPGFDGILVVGARTSGDQCKVNSDIKNALNSKVGKAAISKVIKAALNHKGPTGVAEYGSWVGQKFDGSFYRTVPFTDGFQTTLQPNGRRSNTNRGSKVGNWFKGNHQPHILIHAHPAGRPPSPLHSYDRRTARSLRIILVAVDKAGNVSCYDGR